LETALEIDESCHYTEQLVTLLFKPGLHLFVSETNTQTSGLHLFVSETNTQASKRVYSDLLQVLVHWSGTAGTFCSGAA